MTSKLGCYWSVEHRRESDYAYFKALQPSVFKIMDGGTPDYTFARDNLPAALVIARDWALSEQHGDMLANPVGTGTPPTGQASGDNWSRAWPIVLDIEGGLSTDPNDRGNYRPDGTFVGTNFGISANAHPDVDIVNLTKEQALAIYKHEYWDASGANNLEWPLSLAVFDYAVNAGVDVAKHALLMTDGDFDRYNAWRLKWYTLLDQFDLYGPAWVRRVATIMESA